MSSAMSEPRSCPCGNTKEGDGVDVCQVCGLCADCHDHAMVVEPTEAKNEGT